MNYNNILPNLIQPNNQNQQKPSGNLQFKCLSKLNESNATHSNRKLICFQIAKLAIFLYLLTKS